MRTIFEAAANSDSTEGRGIMVAFAYFEHEAEAVLAVQSAGVMGVGTGDVYAVPLFETEEEHLEYERERAEVSKRTGKQVEKRRRTYGYRMDWRGQWGYGYIDNRDAPVNDPEYVEFVRLAKKFGVTP